MMRSLCMGHKFRSRTRPTTMHLVAGVIVYKQIASLNPLCPQLTAFHTCSRLPFLCRCSCEPVWCRELKRAAFSPRLIEADCFALCNTATYAPIQPSP